MVSVLCELQKQKQKQKMTEKNKYNLHKHNSSENTEVYLGLKASVCGLLNKSWTGSKL